MYSKLSSYRHTDEVEGAHLSKECKAKKKERKWWNLCPENIRHFLAIPYWMEEIKYLDSCHTDICLLFFWGGSVFLHSALI